MKKKSYYLLVVFVSIFAIATIVGLMLPTGTGIKIFGLLFGIYVFFNLKAARISLVNPLLRTMWGLAVATFFLLPAYFVKELFFLGAAALLTVQISAPVISQLLGFDNCNYAKGWDEYHTDIKTNCWTGTAMLLVILLPFMISTISS